MTSGGAGEGRGPLAHPAYPLQGPPTPAFRPPAGVAGLQGFIIGNMFMSVFSFASDTILQAFLVDEEMKRQDGMRPAIMNQFIEGASTN